MRVSEVTDIIEMRKLMKWMKV